MCGICGIMHFNGEEPSDLQLKRMTDILQHRGPDDQGFFHEHQIGLGFRRLSIIDLQEGHQPLGNEDGSLQIIFNGEVYNYKHLRNELLGLGHVFKTHTDTEVIVHLYEEFGEECVKHLRGMFSFVIWDRKRRELFGARDHFGIKPFYYYKDQDQLVFGSEIKSILTVEGIDRKVDTESLINYLSFQYVPEPRTMFAGIYKLPPAHSFKVQASGDMKVSQYWDPSFEPVNRPIGEYIEELRDKLKDSVVHHMQSDVSRGCFLSGGIDSTAIASYMRSVEPIKTFSVGFDGASNETIIAEQTAKALGTDHYAQIITEHEFFDAIPQAIFHQDEPVADPSAIALYHVARLAKEHVTVVLSGEGADEIFGGYRIYREPHALRPLEWIPLPLRRLIHHCVRRLPRHVKGRNYLLRGTTPLEERFIGNARIFSEDMKSDILKLDSRTFQEYPIATQITAKFYKKSAHLDAVTRMQYIDLNLWLPGDILMKADKMTMAHSLELRVPFLDKELFELARRIPANYRIANGTTKYIFRKAMEGIIPYFILQRPKLGFPVPLRDWLKGKRGDMIVEQIKASGIDEYIRFKAVDNLLLQHRRGEGDYSRNIWAIYVFAQWHMTYMLPSLFKQRELVQYPEVDIGLGTQEHEKNLPARQ